MAFPLQKVATLIEQQAKMLRLAGSIDIADCSIKGMPMSDWQTQLAHIENQSGIYSISIAEGDEGQFQSLRDALKRNESSLAISRDNKRISRCLYVGSSRSLKTRLRQHFGPKPRGTYALHLSEWGLPDFWRFDVDIYQHESFIDPAVMQLVEDAMWDKFEPMFGKRGAR